MRYYNLLEGRNSRCIVIDVQPEYTGVNDGSELPWIDDMMAWLNRQGPVLMFVNAEDTGITMDTIPDIQEYWNDSGYDPSKWNQTTIVDKGYGYMRAWMDQGVSDAAIIKTIRELYNQKKTDTRELFSGDDSETYQDEMSNFLGYEWHEWMADDSLIVEWTSIGQLKQFNGAYLMGGGREECLREVTLLMNAFNIKYKLVQEFIYG